MRAFLRGELRHGARSALRPAGPWGHALRRGEAIAAAYSGGETAQPPNDESPSSGSQIIGKGKHKGLLYRECLARDPQYCEFLLSQAHKMGGEYRGLIEYIRSQQADEHDYHRETPGGGDTVLGFGKYKGMTWQQVVEDDPDYCKWVVSQATAGATGGDPPRQDFVDFMVYIQGSAAAVGASAAPAPAPLGSRGQGYNGAGAFESEAGESPPLFSGKWPITFGTKYKNWTFDEVVKADEPYCDFIVQQVLHSTVPKGTGMTAFAFYVQHVRFALGVQAST